MRNLMQARLAQLRAERAENGDNADKGFTLIELLVVVVIIGILIAIAIPLYLHFENGAKTSSAESDVHNAVAVVQQCAADNAGTLPGDVTSTAGPTSVIFCGTGADAQEATVSSGNTLTYTVANGDYTIDVKNADSGKTYEYDSATGQTKPLP
jgi:type IV pilus assembly protein PilA